jgi:hypothetical protein
MRKNMRTKIKIQISLRVLAILILLAGVAPSQGATMKSQLTVLTLPGTDIYVDGTYTDHCYGYYLPVVVTYGMHTIKLTKPKYHDYVTTVNVDTKISSMFADNLIPLSAANPSANPSSLGTTDLLRTADLWSKNMVPPGYSAQITTQQLLTIANKWANN